MTSTPKESTPGSAAGGGDGSYSPSLSHHHLIDSSPPSMAYDGGDVAAWQRRLRRKVKSLIGMP